MYIYHGGTFLTRNGNRVELTAHPSIANKFVGMIDGILWDWRQGGYFRDPVIIHDYDIVAEARPDVSIDDLTDMYSDDAPSDPTAPPSDYADLHAILGEAFNQSANGKGKDRHANHKPFDRQPIMEIGRMVGPGYAIGQAMKKLQEAMTMQARGHSDAADRELLGSIVYAAAAAKLIRENQPAKG